MADHNKTVLCIGATLLNVIAGCASKPTLEVRPWEPTAQELTRGIEVAQCYARDELNVSRDQLGKMKIKSHGWSIDGRKTMRLEFYDPAHFPDWEKMRGVFGGFPDYFAISVDVSSWIVVDHYASPE